MSLFIGSLAFERGAFDQLAATRFGVLAGSVLAATAGYRLLRRAFEPQSKIAPTGAKEGVTQ